MEENKRYNGNLKRSRPIFNYAVSKNHDERLKTVEYERRALEEFMEDAKYDLKKERKAAGATTRDGYRSLGRQLHVSTERT